MNSNNHPHPKANDPRLNKIPKERLQILFNMAEQLKQAPPSQKLPVFLSLQKNVSVMDISFSDAERELLLSVFTEGMSQEDLKKVQMIRNLSDQIKRSEKGVHN